MAASAPARVDAVRGFNRFYTRQIGVLGERLLDSPFSLSEMRVLYELAHRDSPTAVVLAKDLALDPGYLSRMLRRFETRGLLARTPSPADARHALLRLTARGRSSFAALEQKARTEVSAMLGHLSSADQRHIVDAMGTIERLLGPRSPDPLETAEAPDTTSRTPYLLRPHQPGDMGWVVHRHGALYAREWGYNEEFEALVARIVADFLDNFDPKRERCWIAERDGDIVGSVFLVNKTKTIAKLRLLLVDPQARGLGIGRRLVDESIRFARLAGYRTLTLWTQGELAAARHLYKQAGFRRTRAEPGHSFGKETVAETWELRL
jgi:DNA-binding MarR family transcriptional regulator/GNAT superfamily N-acetyltransferase